MDIVAERIFEEMSAAGTAHALPLNFRSVPEVCVDEAWLGFVGTRSVHSHSVLQTRMYSIMQQSW